MSVCRAAAAGDTGDQWSRREGEPGLALGLDVSVILEMKPNQGSGRLLRDKAGVNDCPHRKSVLDGTE